MLQPRPREHVDQLLSTATRRGGDLRKKMKKAKESVHRTGIEPVPLAWKASMITTSPSVCVNLISG
jgi:hypothetical protein